MNETMFLLHYLCELYHNCSFVHQYLTLFLLVFIHGNCAVILIHKRIINYALCKMHSCCLFSLSEINR